MRTERQRERHLDRWAREGANPDFMGVDRHGKPEKILATVEVPENLDAVTSDNPTGAGTPHVRVSVHSREYFEYLAKRHELHRERERGTPTAKPEPQPPAPPPVPNAPDGGTPIDFDS